MDLWKRCLHGSINKVGGCGCGEFDVGVGGIGERGDWHAKLAEGLP